MKHSLETVALALILASHIVLIEPRPLFTGGESVGHPPSKNGLWSHIYQSVSSTLNPSGKYSAIQEPPLQHPLLEEGSDPSPYWEFYQDSGRLEKEAKNKNIQKLAKSIGKLKSQLIPEEYTWNKWIKSYEGLAMECFAEAQKALEDTKLKLEERVWALGIITPLVLHFPKNGAQKIETFVRHTQGNERLIVELAAAKGMLNLPQFF